MLPGAFSPNFKKDGKTLIDSNVRLVLRGKEFPLQELMHKLEQGLPTHLNMERYRRINEMVNKQGVL